MNPRSFPFSKNRFGHVLLDRQGDVCLVERTNLVTGSIHYEVIARAALASAKAARRPGHA